jgi:hypothetical protein
MKIRQIAVPKSFADGNFVSANITALAFSARL